MRILIFIFFLMLSGSIAQGQVVEIQGELRVTMVKYNPISSGYGLCASPQFYLCIKNYNIVNKYHTLFQ